MARHIVMNTICALFKLTKKVSIKNLVCTGSHYCADLICNETGNEYDIFILPKNITKDKELHLLNREKPLTYNDVTRGWK